MKRSLLFNGTCLAVALNPPFTNTSSPRPYENTKGRVLVKRGKGYLQTVQFFTNFYINPTN